MEHELIYDILLKLHPAAQGWKRLHGCQLDDVQMDHVFFCKGKLPVAALLMESAYVNADDLLLVQHLKELYRQKMNGRELHVMLVYQELLIRPQRLPNEMSVLALSEVMDGMQAMVMN